MVAGALWHEGGQRRLRHQHVLEELHLKVVLLDPGKIYQVWSVVAVS